MIVLPRATRFASSTIGSGQASGFSPLRSGGSWTAACRRDERVRGSHIRPRHTVSPFACSQHRGDNASSSQCKAVQNSWACCANGAHG